jgi:hemerythrin-like domain-containing protein
MQALESLTRDHQVLWGLTEALEAVVAALDAGQRLERGDLRDLAHGFRTIADYRHFEKEDEVLVPLLVRHGFDYNLQILGDARREHDALRYLIRVLEQAAERELSWTLYERQRIAGTARSLVERQRSLATLQEIELFPEVVTRLEPAVLGQLTEELWEFDEASTTRGFGLDVAALRSSLLARYRTPLPPSRELSR